jgi:cytochrome oxidase Cu insertion factor (SCO1/SenC/PrrC family)
MEIKDRVLYLVAGIVVMTGIALVVLSGHRGARLENAGIGSGSDAPVAAGGQAADFKLEKLDGTTVSLESLRGKVVFLNVGDLVRAVPRRNAVDADVV